jgi:exonuclease VII small subunit
MITKQRPSNAKGQMGYTHPGGIVTLDELDHAEHEVLRCQTALEANQHKRSFFLEYRDRPAVGYKRLVALQREIVQLLQKMDYENAKLDCAALMVETCDDLEPRLNEHLSAANKKVHDIREKRRKERMAAAGKTYVSKAKPLVLDDSTKSQLAAGGVDVNKLMAMLALMK